MTATTANRLATIVKRDARLRLSYPSEVLSSLWGVVVSVFMFFFIGELVGDSPLLADTQGGYFAFAVTGMTVVSLSFATIGVFRSTFEREQAGGTLELLLAGTTKLRVLLAGSMGVPLVFAGIQALGFAGLGWMFAPQALSPGAWVKAFPVLILIVMAFAAMGLWSAAFVIVAQRGDPFSGVFIQATNLVAGAVFPVALLPDWLQVVAHLVPAFYGFEALRGLMLSGATWASVVDELVILALFDIVLALVGIYLLRRALRFARIMGTLGTA